MTIRLGKGGPAIRQWCRDRPETKPPALQSRRKDLQVLTYSRGAAPNATPRRITGQYLAHAHLSQKQRAKLAADLSNGTLEVVPLTTRQAAMVARVPVLDVTPARRDSKPGNGQSNGRGETPGRAYRAEPPSGGTGGRAHRRRRGHLGHDGGARLRGRAGRQQCRSITRTYSASASETAPRGVPSHNGNAR